MQLKLTKELGTKYFVRHWLSPLTAFVRAHKDDIIDIAGARFTPECARAIQSHPSLIDTEDAVRELELRENDRRFADNEKSELLPNYNATESLSFYIKQLSNKTIYSVSSQQLPLGVVVTLYRPEVRLEFDNYYNLFKYVEPHVPNGNFAEFYKRRGGTFVISKTGTIPTVFGREKLRDSWKSLLDRATADLSNQEIPMRIVDYIEVN